MHFEEIQISTGALEIATIVRAVARADRASATSMR